MKIPSISFELLSYVMHYLDRVIIESMEQEEKYEHMKTLSQDLDREK
jgi:hypothetical protein